MKMHRVYAIILRHLYLFRHSLDRLSDVFYWPIVDILLWGLTGLYIQKTSSELNVMTMILSGILLWIIVWRGQYEVAVNLLEDLLSKNLINIFASPLKFREWISAFLIIGLIKSVASLAFVSLVAYLLYHFNVLALGFYLLPFFIILIMFGWAVGFFVSGIILRYGARLHTLAWSAITLISPFSAIYYPLSILPLWAQKVAIFVPISYIFEGGRKILIYHQQLSWNYFLFPFMISIIYLFFAALWFRKSFIIILEKKGLIKVF